MPAEHAPSYVPQAELLLGTPAFYDDERENQLHDRDNPMTFTAETAGMRGLLYVRMLRRLVEAVKEPSYPDNPSRTIARIGGRHREEISVAARELSVINAAERALYEQEDIFLEGLRNHQQPYMRDIVDFMNIAPQKIATILDDELIETYIRGALVEAPTGLGKTVLIARALVAMGVGQPIENIEKDQSRVRALIVVPTITILQQMTGALGDNTLGQFAPGINIGGYYSRSKNKNADAVVITIEQFVNHFKNGQFLGERFDVLIIDEAHNALQPLFQRAILEHWQSGPIIGFTATPQYSETRDVRNLLPHRIYHGDLLDFLDIMEDNEEAEAILNAAQLFEIRADHDHYLDIAAMEQYEGLTQRDIDQMVLREATAEFLQVAVDEGRRGMVFCEQGGHEPMGHALRMAERLGMLKKPDGSLVRVAVAGYINDRLPDDDPNSNAGIRRRYQNGELDFIVTVEWGREGLNEDIDVVVAAGKITSRLKFWQIIGRGTRLSTRFPVTMYAHIFTPTDDLLALSLFGLFGFETIEQGAMLGVDEDEDEDDEATDSSTADAPQSDTDTPPPAAPAQSGPRPSPASDTDGESGPQTPPAPTPTRTTPRPSPKKQRHAGTPVSAFPLRIQMLLNTIHTKTVGEALFQENAPKIVPENYKQFLHIMDNVPGPPVTIRKYLREEMGFACIGRYEAARRFVFYFEPAAEEYLNQFRGAVARIDLQREFGGGKLMDVTVVEEMADQAGVTPVTWFYRDGKRIPHYKKADAVKIRKVFANIPPAQPTDYSRVKLAAEAKLPNDRDILPRLTNAEKAKKVLKRTTTADGKIRVLDHWTQEDALPIIERFENMREADGGIPAYLVPRELAVRHVKTSKETLENFADSMGHPVEIVRIARGGRPPRCVSWAALKAAEEHFGVRHNNFTIDYTRLPQTFADTRDLAKKAYALIILEKIATLPKK